MKTHIWIDGVGGRKVLVAKDKHDRANNLLARYLGRKPTSEEVATEILG